MWAIAFALLVGAVPLSGARAQRPAVSVGIGGGAPLQPGDTVKVTVWREPDLSGEFEVQPDGSITFPKIGRIQVDRYSPDSLRSLINARYAVSLRDPDIELTPLRRIVVAGSVRNAGFQYADPTVTVLGAVALAGGVTPDGNRGRIDLVRDGRKIPIDLSDPPAVADSALRSGDEVQVPERNWISRNAAVVASGFTAVAIFIAAKIRP